MAGLDWLYQRYFKLYCQFTHGSLRAMLGHLDEQTDPRDTTTVGWCVYSMLELLKAHTPADVPELAEFRQRLEAASPLPQQPLESIVARYPDIWLGSSCERKRLGCTQA
jgi:hypothetical protein